MSFTNPLFLLGLAFLGLPIAIHLWKRRKARREVFPSLVLLLRSKRKVSRRLRLRQLLLLILRTLAIALIPLALAGPFLPTPENPNLPQALAIVLDASYSMGHGSPSAFEKAKDLADDALASLKPGDAAILFVVNGGAAYQEIPEISYEIASIRRELSEQKLSSRAVSIEEDLAAAANALSAAPQPKRRILLLTDGTQNAWGAQGPAIPWSDGGPKLEIIDVSKEKLPNRAILQVSTKAAPETGANSFQIQAKIANYTKENLKELPISLQVGEKIVAKGFVSVAPEGFSEKTFHYTPEEEGTNIGVVTLENDALSIDDQVFFVLKAPKTVKALLVNGDPRTTRYEDEAFFVLESLVATEESTSKISAEVITTEGLDRDDLETFDVVALLNVGSIGTESLQTLRTFVENGGGLLITGGSQVARSLSALDPLLPVRFRDVFVASDGAFSGGGVPRRLAPTEREHPLFQDFDPIAPGAMGLAQFGTILLFQTEVNANAKTTLLSFDDGAPALIEGTIGAGKVLVFASTIDRDWTDLPIRPGYVPFIQNLFRYLGGVLSGQAQLSSPVGKTRSFSVPSTNLGHVSVTPPDQNKRELLPSDFLKGEIKIDRIDHEGVWQLHLFDEQDILIDEIFFPASLEVEESILTKVDPDIFSRLEEQSGNGIATEIVGNTSLPSGYSFTSYLLLGLLLLLLIESFVLIRK